MTESRTYQLGVNGFAQWTIENAARRRSSPAAAGTCCRRDVTSPRFHASPPLTNHVRATRLPRTRLRMVSCSKVEMLERWRMWLWHFQANRRWGTRNWETVLKNPVRFVKWRAGSIACVKVLLSDFTNSSSSSLWSSCVADADIIFLSCFFFMAALCNRGPLYFCPVVSFFLSSFFSRLISAAAGWMSTILDTWCGPSANLECRSERCCTRLAANAGPKKFAKIAIWAPSHNFVGLYLRN